MASFLTLLSRYIGKKTKYVEKQQVKAEKEKKTKAKEFAKTYPTHDKQLKSWEKTYGEKKQKADAKYTDERTKRVKKARAMGPEGRKKKYRTASIYMAKDPFTKPPVKPRNAGKTTYLTKKAKKKNDFITKMNAPIKEELLKENTRMGMPPLRNISQSLIDAVKEAQKNQPAVPDKALDISLKGIDTKQPLKEEQVDESLYGTMNRLKNKVARAIDGDTRAKRVDKFVHKLQGQREKIDNSDAFNANMRHSDLDSRAKYAKSLPDNNPYLLKPMSGKPSLGSNVKALARTTHKMTNSVSRLGDTLKKFGDMTAAAKDSSAKAVSAADVLQKAANKRSKQRYLQRKKDGTSLIKKSKTVKEEQINETDYHFLKQQIDGHRKAAAEAKKRGDHHKAMAHEQQARDYEQHGMSGSRWETSSGLKYEEVNMDNETVTEGAKKIKLTPGMSKKDFKSQKTAMKQKVVAKAKKAAVIKKVASNPAPAKAAPAADDEDDKMLSRLLKGKLKHGDHPHLAKQIVSKIRTTDVRDRAAIQKKIYHAQGDELHNLLK